MSLNLIANNVGRWLENVPGGQILVGSDGLVNGLVRKSCGLRVAKKSWWSCTRLRLWWL